MQEDERLSSVIGGVYDAALDPALWPPALGQAAQFADGWSAALFWKDATSKSGGVYYDDGRMERRYVQLYFDKYVKYDPSTTGHYFAELERPMATGDIIAYDEFRDTRFYREWAKPQGLVDFVSAVLDRSTTSVAMFGMFRHERHGVANEETRRRVGLIVPHVRRAVLIGRAIDLRTAEAASFADSLDGLSAGMFLVDASGRITHANAAGHGMVAEGSVLRAVGGRLTASEAEPDRLLRDSFTAAGAGDAGIGIKGIAVALTGASQRHVAHVLPLTSGARRRAGATYAAVAAVFVHRASPNLPSPPETMAKTYKLTPTELRVLLAVVEVGGVPEVAEALGVAATTVKTHLGRLYVKTGCRRQADLVKLVAGFCNPLVA
jgi:DNA-binding CsgD family transcriptional regulator